MGKVFYFRLLSNQSTMPFLASHPFADSSVVMLRGKNGLEYVNLLEKDGEEQFRKHIVETLKRADSISKTLTMISKKYRFTFLDHIKNHLSEYVSEMEQNTYQGKYKIYSWDKDYKTLKHLRWIRNRIAHDSEGFQICEPQDIDDMQNFYDRLLSVQDPLALLRKMSLQENRNLGAAARPIYEAGYRHPPQSRSLLIAVGISGIVIIAISLVFFFFLR